MSDESLDFEVHEESFDEIEFDLRDRTDNEASSTVLCDEPFRPSEVAIPLETVFGLSSPRNAVDVSLKNEKRDSSDIRPVRDVSKLVDDLVGFASVAHAAPRNVSSVTTTGHTTPVVRAVGVKSVPKPMAIARTPSKASPVVRRKPVRCSPKPRRKSPVRSSPSPALSHPVWRDVFQEDGSARSKAVNSRSKTTRGWKCPDGWIPHHRCDEFCFEAFQ